MPAALIGRLTPATSSNPASLAYSAGPGSPNADHCSPALRRPGQRVSMSAETRLPVTELQAPGALKGGPSWGRV